MSKNIKGPQESTKEICYINTDLDIRADRPIDKLVKYFKKAGLIEVQYHKEKDKNGLWYWCGEVETPPKHNKTPEYTISEFIKILNSFSPDELKEWNNCRTKIFNIGYECGVRPSAFSNHLSSKLINQINKLGVGIEITIYPEIID